MELDRILPTAKELETEGWRRRAPKARASLAEFVRQSWSAIDPSPLEWNWHIEAICDHVQAVLDDWIKHKADSAYVQRCRNLLINVPPGSGKSRVVSVCAVAWMWLRCPSWRVMCLSANPTIAMRDARYCRELLESAWYQTAFAPDWTLADDQNAKSLYYNSYGGYRRAMGMSAKVVGERADCILIDDPCDPKEIHSEAHRRAVNEGWDVAIANRVNDLRTSTRIGVMQRLHEEDWAGHVLAKGDLDWHRLCLPTEYEPDRFDLAPGHKDYVPRVTFTGWSDPRKVRGEVLHPVRLPPKEVESERRRGAFYFAGQHQQRPSPEAGGMFQRLYWRFWKPDGAAPDGTYPRPRGCTDQPARGLPVNMMGVISVDASFKGKATSDYVVVLVVMYDGPDRYVLACRRGKWGFSQTTAIIRDVVAQYPAASKKLIEEAANGAAIVETLAAEIPGVIAITPEGGKESRAAAISHFIEGGNVYLPEGAPWLDDWVDEFASFPNGSHDDQVDALSQALNYLRLSPSAARILALTRG